MRIVDLAGLALKTLKGRWAVLPLAGFAIGAFCLCFAGAVFTTVQREKAAPFELDVSVQGNTTIADNTLAKLSGIPGVIAATPLLPIPATVESGNYTAQLTLTGIDGTYLSALEQGGIFPESSTMPYIILNKAACRLFSTDGKREDTVMGSAEDAEGAERAPPPIDWLNAAFAVQMGEGTRPIVSKVCGILAGEDEEQEPAAYISLSVAKALLRNSGQIISLTTAKVCVENIGKANSVSRAIAALGLTVGDTNAQMQAKWDAETEQMSFLLGTGVFALLCAVVLLAAWRKISVLEQGQAWSMLLWMGMERRDVGRIFLLQAGMLSLCGAAIGAAVAAALPSFLPQELMGKSIFMLTIPWEVATVGVAMGFVCGTLPMIHRVNSSIAHIDSRKEVQHALAD